MPVSNKNHVFYSIQIIYRTKNDRISIRQTDANAIIYSYISPNNLPFLELGNHVDVVVLEVVGDVGCLQKRRIPKKIDASNLYANNVKPCALAQVGQKFLAASGVDEGKLRKNAYLCGMATWVVYTFLMAALLGINAWAYYEAEFGLVCLYCCISLLICYIVMANARRPTIAQRTMATLPCSKPRLLMLRIGEVLLLPEVVALYGISALAIGKSDIGLAAKFAAIPLQLLAVSFCIALGTMLENLYSSLKKVRSALQIPMFIGMVLNIMVIRGIGTDAPALFYPLWWALMLGLVVAVAALLPFAKRWNL